MFHATAMGPDYDAILDPLAHLFGCRVMHRWQQEEPVGRDGGMTWIGDNSIEIGAPYGDGSSVAAFVERFGGGMHSVAVQVDDLAATLRRVEPLGVEVAARIGPDIVFTRPGATAGIVFEWGSHVQDDDPRSARPRCPTSSRRSWRWSAWRSSPRSCTIRRPPRGGWPRCSTPRWSSTPSVPATRSAPTSRTPRSISATACSRSTRSRRTPRPAGRSGATCTNDRAASHSRCRWSTRRVAERALAAEGVNVHHRAADGRVVLVDGLPFPIVLTDQLLPGDPRGVDATQEER